MYYTHSIYRTIYIIIIIVPTELNFNIIFEFSANFTCYLTYYKPIAKKVDLTHPRRGRAVRAQNRFSTSFLNSAPFLPVIWHTISLLPKKIVWRARVRALGVRCARNELSTSFLNSAPFLPAIWHTISLLPKKSWFGAPVRAWACPRARQINFQYHFWIQRRFYLLFDIL